VHTLGFEQEVNTVEGQYFYSFAGMINRTNSTQGNEYFVARSQLSTKYSESGIYCPREVDIDAFTVFDSGMTVTEVTMTGAADIGAIGSFWYSHSDITGGKFFFSLGDSASFVPFKRETLLLVSKEPLGNIDVIRPEIINSEAGYKHITKLFRNYFEKHPKHAENVLRGYYPRHYEPDLPSLLKLYDERVSIVVKEWPADQDDTTYFIEGTVWEENGRRYTGFTALVKASGVFEIFPNTKVLFLFTLDDNWYLVRSTWAPETGGIAYQVVKISGLQLDVIFNEGGFST